MLIITNYISSEFKHNQFIYTRFTMYGTLFYLIIFPDSLKIADPSFYRIIGPHILIDLWKGCVCTVNGLFSKTQAFLYKEQCGFQAGK